MARASAKQDCDPEPDPQGDVEVPVGNWILNPADLERWAQSQQFIAWASNIKREGRWVTGLLPPGQPPVLP